MSSEVTVDMSVGRWKRYTAYRDSGVEWIGEVPEGWETWKVKHTTYVKGRIGWQGLKSDEFIDEGPYLVTGTDFLDGKVNWETSYHVSEERYNEDSYIQLCENDLLITKDGTIGKTAIVKNLPDNACLNSGIFLTRSISGNYITEFMYWLLNSVVFTKFIDYTKTGTTINHLYQNVFVDFAYPVPHISEQRAIAAFLDCETGRIDTLIEKKERQVGLLQEKRAALISHAITKGLDPNVKMKDSGIEWLEVVPEHWAETITSALFMDNKKKNKGAKETNLLSLSYGNIIRKDINTNEGLLPETFEAYQIVDPGYIILRLTDLQNDKKSLRVGHVNERGIITSAYTGLRKKSDAVECSKYFYYLLHTYDIIKVFYGMGGGVRQSLNFNELRKIRLLLPPPEEQTTIVAFIDRETEHIDTLTTKLSESISKLLEYRIALISAAVTGKIDVREDLVS